MAQASRLFLAIGGHAGTREVERVTAVQNRGFEGCAHGRPGSGRQVLLVEGETLDDLALEPGIFRENITTRGLSLLELAAGQRLRIGEATLEVTMLCEPCELMDEIRMGLQQEIGSRRGTLCCVVEGGLISRGDSIEIVEHATFHTGAEANLE